MKIAVIGLGSFGSEVASQLTEKGIDVMALDKDEAKVNEIRNKVTQAICMDLKDEEALRNIGIDEMDTVIISIGKNFEYAVLLTRIIKNQLKIKHVITRTTDQIKKEIIELVGADQVILPEKEAATLLAQELTSPFPHSICLNEDFSIIDIKAPDEFVGKKIEEINFEKNYHCKCIAIKRQEKILQAEKDEIIQENDVLYLAGKNKNLKSVFNL